MNSRLLSPAAVAFAAYAPFVLGCNDGPTAPLPIEYVRVIPDWVADEAAAALDPITGQFRLAAIHPGHISLFSAETLAVAVARLYGSPNQIGNAPIVAQLDRGGPIHFNDLRVCHRTIYAESPFGEFPAPVPSGVRRAWGPHWAIALCGRDGKAQMSVGVPDNPMEVRVENGEIIFPRFSSGSHFHGTGVPFRYPFGLPLTPEEAVAAVFMTTGRRVVRVPIAFNQHDHRGAGQLSLCASWRIRVHEPVVVRSVESGQTHETADLFVRNTPACFSDSIAIYIAAEQQPESRWISYRADTSSRFDLDSIQVSLTGPVIFERVTVQR